MASAYWNNLSRVIIAFSLIVFQIKSLHAECFPPGTTPILKPVNLPAGLGIKEILYIHARDEVTTFTTRLNANGVLEMSSQYLHDRISIVVKPADQGILTGHPGVVSYSIIGNWHWGQPDQTLQFPRIDIAQTPTYHEILYWTACADQYPNTSIKIEFSNYQD